MSHTVYIVECSDKTLYTGTAAHVINRVFQHNKTGAGAKYTRARRPVTLVYTEVLPSLSVARKREAEIKRLSRKQKMELI
ncbi:endonuclease [Candidatus Uhrbacteria bacterium RIFCSPLOWO2_02_FULL_51_9]|uniref:Endonuclease n=1 Tax=Candidatus Uhrbacteria bacterium RIFCSPLOWO2_02_FULL_51_9 TaxID=1802410 RepID=A0A1F7VGM6_9BACT|nr:MAG: endonuclease [Candidatus Uhrbacteria bacterium RIFCSPLOWO2_02_FULL_51_9]